jgi:hypothetical protein
MLWQSCMVLMGERINHDFNPVTLSASAARAWRLSFSLRVPVVDCGYGCIGVIEQWPTVWHGFGTDQEVIRLDVISL